MKTVLFLNITFVIYIYLVSSLPQQQSILDLPWALQDSEDINNYITESYENKPAAKVLSSIPDHSINRQWRNELEKEARKAMNNARLWDSIKRHSRPLSAFLYKKRGRTNSRLLDMEDGDPLKYMIYSRNMIASGNEPRRDESGLAKRPFCNGFYGCHNYPKKLTQNPVITFRMDPAQSLKRDYDGFSRKRLIGKGQDNFNTVLNKKFKRSFEDYPELNDQEDWLGQRTYIPESEPVKSYYKVKRRVKTPFCNSFTGCNSG